MDLTFSWLAPMLKWSCPPTWSENSNFYLAIWANQSELMFISILYAKPVQSFIGFGRTWRRLLPDDPDSDPIWVGYNLAYV